MTVSTRFHAKYFHCKSCFLKLHLNIYSAKSSQADSHARGFKLREVVRVRLCLHHHGSDMTWHPAYPDYVSYWLWTMAIWVSKSYRILMIEVEWASETLNDINDQHRCLPAKILLISVSVKASRHLYSKDVSLKLFKNTQPYQMKMHYKTGLQQFTAIFTENQMTWVCSAWASRILWYSIKQVHFI